MDHATVVANSTFKIHSFEILHIWMYYYCLLIYDCSDWKNNAEKFGYLVLSWMSKLTLYFKQQ